LRAFKRSRREIYTKRKSQKLFLIACSAIFYAQAQHYVAKRANKFSVQILRFHGQLACKPLPREQNSATMAKFETQMRARRTNKIFKRAERFAIKFL